MTENLWKNKQKWNIKGEKQTYIWIVLSFYFFCPCWRRIHKPSEEERDFFSPLVLFTIFRVGFRAGFAFLGRGLQCLEMFVPSAESWGSISHPQGVLCAQQIPALAPCPGVQSCCPAPASSGQGTPALKSSDGSSPWDTWEMVRNPTPWDTDHHPSPSDYFLNSHFIGSSLRDDWNKPCRIWLSCHLLLIINDKSQGTATNYNVGASYLLGNRLEQN